MTQRPVRVAFVSSHATLGGSERYLELLLEHIGADWIARVIALQDGPFVARLRRTGHEVEIVGVPRRAGVAQATVGLRRSILRRRPQVVHANGLKAAVVAGLACLGTGIPVIWVKHDFARDGWVARSTALLCRRVVGVSTAVTATFGPRLQRRVDVVPNAVPVVEVDAGLARARLGGLVGAPPRAPVVLLLARITPVKGQIELVETAQTLLDSHPDVRFALVGEEDPSHPDYAASVRARIAELGLGERIRLIGHREDAIVLTAGADVLVVPSGPPGASLRGEGFGLVALEALSVGTPVVGYAAGALPEVLEGRALLVRPGDRQALAEALVRVIEEPGLRERLISAGREQLAAYSPEILAERMRVCYRAAARIDRGVG
jgi:glycosyltransferase involved in cell wall biosynthesis